MIEGQEKFIPEEAAIEVVFDENEEGSEVEVSNKPPTKEEVYVKPRKERENIVFDTDGGTAVVVKKERYLASGQYGAIYEADLEVPGKEGRAKEYKGVIKDYSEGTLFRR